MCNLVQSSYKIITIILDIDFGKIVYLHTIYGSMKILFNPHFYLQFINCIMQMFFDYSFLLHSSTCVIAITIFLPTTTFSVAKSLLQLKTQAVLTQNCWALFLGIKTDKADVWQAVSSLSGNHRPGLYRTSSIWKKKSVLICTWVT